MLAKEETNLKDNAENKVCTCGRGFSHCRVCGSRNVYVKRFRSLELSTALGRQVVVFGCRRCSEESNETEPCNAPQRDFKTGYKAYEKPIDLPPWGSLVPGSTEYAAALIEAAVKITEKGSTTLIQAYVELKKQGWQPELYEMDSEVKEALELAGLTPANRETTNENISQGVATAIKEQPSQGSSGRDNVKPEDVEPVSLEDIIKNMQENSK